MIAAKIAGGIVASVAACVGALAWLWRREDPFITRLPKINGVERWSG